MYVTDGITGLGRVDRVTLAHPSLRVGGGSDYFDGASIWEERGSPGG